jgi:hypothetical protein
MAEYIKSKNRKKSIAAAVLVLIVLLMTIECLFAGSANMTFMDCIHALLRKGTPAQIRIIWNISTYSRGRIVCIRAYYADNT